MAEHDEIVRKAAEAAVFEITDNYRYRPEVPTPEQMIRVLAPFFAAARKEAVEQALRRERELDEKTNRAIERRIRKEAREGALEEAIAAQCQLCQERIPFSGEWDHRLPSGKTFPCRASSTLRALRSKPKEPA